MELINCKNCGTLTVDRFEGYCMDCGYEREVLISQVKDFLLVNRHAGVNEILEQTEIPAKLIFKFIQEGRISVSQSAAKPSLAYSYKQK